jgi:hypothetical protein
MLLVSSPTQYIYSNSLLAAGHQRPVGVLDDPVGEASASGSIRVWLGSFLSAQRSVSERAPSAAKDRGSRRGAGPASMKRVFGVYHGFEFLD